jgi:cellulose synthase/poly-beta-1,6-N-acetylglucosamine synthase-like glycosyltransferase
MAWRRATLDAIGGFDPALGSGTPMRAGEELDAFRRLLTRGGVVVYEPAALVWHDHPETMRALRRKLVSYSVGSGAQLAKVLFEEGRDRRVALRTAARDTQWRLQALRREGLSAVLGRPHLPLLALVAHPAAVVVGMGRFLRHRGTVRFGA